MSKDSGVTSLYWAWGGVFSYFSNFRIATFLLCFLLNVRDSVFRRELSTFGGKVWTSSKITFISNRFMMKMAESCFWIELPSIVTQSCISCQRGPSLTEERADQHSRPCCMWPPPQTWNRLFVLPLSFHTDQQNDLRGTDRPIRRVCRCVQVQVSRTSCQKSEEQTPDCVLAAQRFSDEFHKDEAFISEEFKHSCWFFSNYSEKFWVLNRLW